MERLTLTHTAHNPGEVSLGLGLEEVDCYDDFASKLQE